MRTSQHLISISPNHNETYWGAQVRVYLRAPIERRTAGVYSSELAGACFFPTSAGPRRRESVRAHRGGEREAAGGR